MPRREFRVLQAKRSSNIEAAATAYPERCYSPSTFETAMPARSVCPDQAARQHRDLHEAHGSSSKTALEFRTYRGMTSARALFISRARPESSGARYAMRARRAAQSGAARSPFRAQAQDVKLGGREIIFCGKPRGGFFGAFGNVGDREKKGARAVGCRCCA